MQGGSPGKGCVESPFLSSKGGKKDTRPPKSTAWVPHFISSGGKSLKREEVHAKGLGAQVAPGAFYPLGGKKGGTGHEGKCAASWDLFLLREDPSACGARNAFLLRREVTPLQTSAKESAFSWREGEDGVGDPRSNATACAVEGLRGRGGEKKKKE